MPVVGGDSGAVPSRSQGPTCGGRLASRSESEHVEWAVGRWGGEAGVAVVEDSGHVMRSEVSLRWGEGRFLARGSSSRTDARSTRPFPRASPCSCRTGRAAYRARRPGRAGTLAIVSACDRSRSRRSGCLPFAAPVCLSDPGFDVADAIKHDGGTRHEGALKSPRASADVGGGTQPSPESDSDRPDLGTELRSSPTWRGRGSGLRFVVGAGGAHVFVNCDHEGRSDAMGSAALHVCNRSAPALDLAALGEGDATHQDGR